MVHEIENFYGVYLLYCTNEKYRGRTYIGFTVNPNRRIKQHNKGIAAGGAKRTNGKGPWEMVLIVHGFPNMISALRFEWAWTKPKVSRRLRHLPGKSKKENKFQYCVRMMCEMLLTGPWNRLPLTIRWLKQEYMIEFDAQRLPPPHMPIEYGPVKSIKVKKNAANGVVVNGETDNSHTTQGTTCFLCLSDIKLVADVVECFACSTLFHMVCLAKRFLRNEPACLLPVEGACPKCRRSVLWGDLIRYKRGCYRNPGDIQQANGIESELEDGDDDDGI